MTKSTNSRRSKDAAAELQHLHVTESPALIAHGDAAPAATPAPHRKTKASHVRAMLSAPAGASLQAIMAATGWQAHTVRAALSGLRKTGVEIIRMTSQAGTVYTASVAVVAAIKSSDDQVTNTEARHKKCAASHVSTHAPASPTDATHPDVAL